ncbi:MAG: hypothetical protein ACU83N_10910 [Gammaproteobacteria bacterium]
MTEIDQYNAPILERYSVQAPGADHPLDVESTAISSAEWKISLHGKNLFERAMMPIIRIGGVRVEKYEVTPDGCCIICFLKELPEDGAEISVSYGPGMTSKLAQRFSSGQHEEGSTASPQSGYERKD